jgi:hypothetical protein
MNGLTICSRQARLSAVSRTAAPLGSIGTKVHDYERLGDYLKRQKLMEFVLSFEQIEEIIDAGLPRAAARASWWDTLRSPQEKMPQREACLAAGYIATRLPDGKSVRFTPMPKDKRRTRAGGKG